MNNRTSSLIVFLSYIVGIVIGLYLIIIAVWADMESALYGFPRLAGAGLGGFSCPVLMTGNETNRVSLKVSNPLDQSISPSIKIMISTSTVADEFLENVELAPGESKILEWTVGPDNIDLEQFIFAKALMYSAYPLPSKEDTCGIFIINLPISGKVFLPVLVVISLLGMGWGLYGINRLGVSNSWLEKNFRPMAFLAIILALGFSVSFMVGWIPSILLLAVALLMVFILLGSFFMNERRKR